MLMAGKLNYVNGDRLATQDLSKILKIAAYMHNQKFCFFLHITLPNLFSHTYSFFLMQNSNKFAR